MSTFHLLVSEKLFNSKMMSSSKNYLAFRWIEPFCEHDVSWKNIDSPGVGFSLASNTSSSNLRLEYSVFFGQKQPFAAWIWLISCRFSGFQDILLNSHNFEIQTNADINDIVRKQKPHDENRNRRNRNRRYGLPVSNWIIIFEVFYWLSFIGHSTNATLLMPSNDFFELKIFGINGSYSMNWCC